MSNTIRSAPTPALSALRVFFVSVLVTVLMGMLLLKLFGGDEEVAQVQETGGTAPVVLDMTGFDATLIIDDDVFYDSQTMTEAEIVEFIATVNAGCVSGEDGTVCLSEARFDTTDIATDTYCPGGYEGGEQESAAAIISQVATSCDINPQVLLVLLQKEQGLLTASGDDLSATDYAAATGYGCPDGSECDEQFAGFFLQVYQAAAQFQRYRLNPGDYDIQAGVTTDVSYSPTQGCGSGELTVQNQATAGLYNYTPYQPNANADLGGDDCTSWGNWNFYGYFNTWFGDPTPSN